VGVRSEERGGRQREEGNGLADFGEVAGADLWWLLALGEEVGVRRGGCVLRR
jgi:hypothetical protein